MYQTIKYSSDYYHYDKKTRKLQNTRLASESIFRAK